MTARQPGLSAEPSCGPAADQTDDAFIADHNDVFNDNVTAYIGTIVAEARFKRARANSGSAQGEPFQPGCKTADQELEFGPCFQAYQALFGVQTQ